MVVSTLIRHEVESGSLREVSGFSDLAELPRLLAGTADSPLTARGAEALGLGGRYVSIERVGRNDSLADWIGTLRRSGLGVDLAQSAYIRSQDLAGRARMPAVVAGRDLPEVTAEAFVDWVMRSDPYVPFVAEVDFRNRGPHRLVQGWHFDVHDEHGPGRTRLVLTLDKDDAPIVYQTTDRGYRAIVEQGEPEDIDWFTTQAEDMAIEIGESPEVIAWRPLRIDEEY